MCVYIYEISSIFIGSSETGYEFIHLQYLHGQGTRLR